MDLEKTRAIKRAHYEKNKQQYKDRNAAQLKRNQEFILNYLSTHPCVDCGESDVRCLQFDHRDPTLKVLTISKAIKDRWGLEKLQTEIDKCDVRCANCHAKRTCEQFSWYKM